MLTNLFGGPLAGSLALAVLAACGPTGLTTAGGGETLISVAGGNRAVTTFTDLDTVRDVAVSGERVFVATDFGVLVYQPSGEGAMTRVRTANGLPSDDVRAVVVVDDGSAIVATAGGFARVSADSAVAPFGERAPVGQITAMVRADDGTLWVGGTEGLARNRDGSWWRVGEPVAVTALAKTPEGQLWVGTTNGMLYVEGDVIREHAIGRGIPEGYVRAVVPVRPGQALALLQGPSDTKLGYWDGARWWSYTVPGLDAAPVGLARFGSKLLLLTAADAFELTLGALEGSVRLVALAEGELRGPRSYGARVVAPADLDMIYSAAPAREPPTDVSRPPTPFVTVPEPRPEIGSPELRARAAQFRGMPAAAYFARGIGEDLYVADRNRGITRITSGGFSTHLRSLDLVDPRDLQIAVDSSRNTWVRGVGGSVALYRDGYLSRAPVPEGVTLEAIANGPDGAYALTRVTGQPATLRLYRLSTDGWTQRMERQLVVEPPLVSVPYFGITDDYVVWAALRVEHELGEGPRLRGVAVFGEEGPVVYHRRGATAETDGPGALSMPDEVENIDLNHEGFAWFPSLEGAIRVGNSQAVIFGESRGVRGEVVSDVVVGDGGRVWLAAAEGVGFWEESTGFDFRMPRAVQETRPLALAIDDAGHVWAAGPNGVAYQAASGWQFLNESNGLPSNATSDIEIDAQDRVWLLTSDQVMLFTPTSAGAPAAE